MFFFFIIQYYYSKWLSSWVCTEQNKLLEQFYGNVSSKRDENSALRLLKCETSHGECECVMVTSCPLGFHLLWEHFGLQEVTNKWSDDFRIIKMHMMTARYSHHSVLRETDRQTGEEDLVVKEKSVELWKRKFSPNSVQVGKMPHPYSFHRN